MQETKKNSFNEKNKKRIKLLFNSLDDQKQKMNKKFMIFMISYFHKLNVKNK